MSEKAQELLKYSACDISDALLRLGVPGAGYLLDIQPLNTSVKTVAPATTVLFRLRVDLDEKSHVNAKDEFRGKAISEGSYYSDLVAPQTIVVMSQPATAKSASMGSVHAVRMNQIGVCGILVDGRVRDARHLKAMDMPIWSKSTSIVATKSECKAVAVNVPVHVGDTIVNQGDHVVLDPENCGAVCVPRDKLDQALEILPDLVDQDEKQIAALLSGSTVKEVSTRFAK